MNAVKKAPPSSDRPSGSVVLFFATPREASCALSLLQEVTVIPSPPGMELRRGRHESTEFLILSCGVGKVSAAAAAMFLLERYRPRAVVVSGTAGSLVPELRLGDLVIAVELVPGDVGVIHSEGFGATGPGIVEEGRVVFHPSFPVSEELADAAAAAAALASLPFHRGKILTCDQMVLDPGLRSHLGSTFQALAVEMEGSAVAQVVGGAGVPLAVIRVISDELGHDFVRLEKILPYHGQSRLDLWSKRCRLLVSDPSAANSAREMGKGMRLALNNLRRFLEALLPIFS